MSLINTPPLAAPIVDDEKYAVNAMGQWLMQVFRLCFDVQNSGTTLQRPLTNLYEGKPFTDTTLGIPIWYINGAWRNSAGAPV